MKYKDKISKLYLLILFFGVSLSSCTVEDPVVVTPKTFDQYLQSAIQFYKSERLIVDSCKVGYNKGNFTPVSATSFSTYKTNYLAALKSDSAIIFNPSVTIAQILTANNALSTPGKAFWGKILISDRRELNDSITSCTNLNNKILVGTGAGNVIQEAKTNFLTAIGTASTTRDASTTIDRQVADALTLLKGARLTFISSVIPSDLPTYISNSSSYINSQLSFVNSCKIGYNINEYLQTLQTNYLKVLNSAQTIAGTAGVTYAQLTAAMSALSTPRAAFIPNVADKRMLNDSIVADTLLYTNTTVGIAYGQVSVGAQTNFKTAITTAKTLRDNATTIDGTAKAGNYTLTQSKLAFLNSIPLNFAIVNATTLSSSTAVGTAKGQVSQADKTTFTTAIAAATTVRDAKASTSDQMLSALTTLAAAQAAFTSAIIK